jgi:hypothetical protein
MTMKIIDKNNLIDKINQNLGDNPIVLELGCGKRKKYNDSIGIDIITYESVDIIGDVFDVLASISDSTVNKITSSHFFEHINDVGLLMSEIERILKSDGILDVTVPHFSNSYFYSDVTHKTFFGLYSFCYFSENSYFKRLTPNYIKPQFKLISVNIIFKSSPPFYFRHIIRKFFGLIFNSCNYLKEYYEENICKIISCYEINYTLKRK